VGKPRTEKERYETTDLPFYRDEVAPLLPATVLDFHAHVWRAGQWRAGWGRARGARYLVTEQDYDTRALLRDGARLFPDRRYEAVVFGQPTPSADTDLTNSYVASSAYQPGFYGLRVTGKGRTPQERLRGEMEDSLFFGYKVHIPWTGNDYGTTTVEDMIGPAEMEVAHELKLVVLLHVPGSRRLADPRVRESVASYARGYPDAQIVLAHCGRCYHPDDMRAAVRDLEGLDNVWLDTAMVMDPTLLQMIFETLGPARVLYATDLPVAAMRGRRVYVMDHWVDVVLEGYSPSAFRVASRDIRATFMAWEIVLAIRRASEMAGLSGARIATVFYGNAMALLRRVMDGRRLSQAQACWAQGRA